MLIAALATACGMSNVGEAELEEPDESCATEPPHQGNARAIIALAQTQPPPAKAEPEIEEQEPALIFIDPEEEKKA